MSVSSRLRYEVFRRDDFACRYCGERAPKVQLTVDHVVPVALGGEDQPNNLVTACSTCNAGKSSSSPDQPLVEGVSDDALRWAQAMREAAELQEVERYKLQSYREAFLHHWHKWGTGPDHEREPIPLPQSWPDSLESFYRAGLDIDTITDLIEVAGRSRVGPHGMFRYFCGCCWTELRGRQKIAAALLAREEADGEA